MATISTSIELYDRVSRPINNMIAALGNMCDAYESVERSMDGGFDSASIEQARRATERAALEVVQLGNDIQQNEQHQKAYNREVNNGTSAMNGLVGKALALVGTYATFQTVKQAMNLSDTLTQNKARLDLMNDGLQSTDELVQMVYNSAQNARGSFTDMADVVSRFGNNAKDAFSSNAEVVEFANLIQKQMTIAGASSQEASAAILQLSQGLGSGVLRGEELNSVFEQAPNIIQSIADYLNVPIGKIREMASEGQITADVVKNAIFAASDDINAKFEQMPMTWNQIWTMMGNAALMQFEPVLAKINELANNEQFQMFATGAIDALAHVAFFLLNIMELAGQVASFFYENWSAISPIVWGIATAMGAYALALAFVKLQHMASFAWLVLTTTWKFLMTAATWAVTSATWGQAAAQTGLNAALASCPVVWIVMCLILMIAVIYGVCQAIANLTGIANTGFGVITGGINVVIQFFKNLGLSVANIAIGIGSAVSALATNIMTAFHNAIASVQSWFYDLMSTALGVIESIAAALNKLPFVKFDYSGISSQADAYAAKASEAAGNKKEYESVGKAFSKGFNTYDTFQDGWASEAFDSGAAWGDGVVNKLSDKVSGFFGGMDDYSIPEYSEGSYGGSASGFNTPENLFDGGAYDVGGLGDVGGYDAGQIPSNIADIAENTGSVADSMEITKEDLRYLRDIAEKEAINRFTTAEIKVEMTNNNNISSDMDLDGVVDYLASGVNEAMEKAAEGVHE